MFINFRNVFILNFCSLVNNKYMHLYKPNQVSTIYRSQKPKDEEQNICLLFQYF